MNHSQKAHPCERQDKPQQRDQLATSSVRCPFAGRLEELAAPYYLLKKKGYDVIIASTKGGRIPLDPASLQQDNMTEHSKKFLEDCEPFLCFDRIFSAQKTTRLTRCVCWNMDGRLLSHCLRKDGTGWPYKACVYSCLVTQVFRQAAETRGFINLKQF